MLLATPFPRAVVVEGRYKSADYNIFALAAAGRENLDLTASGGRENLNHAAAEARISDLAGSKCQIFASRRLAAHAEGGHSWA